MRINEPIAYVLLYAFMYAAFGVASPFWPQLFETKGLTSQQIGQLLASAMLVRLAAGPLIGNLADRSGSLRAVLASCAALAAAVAAALSTASTFLLLLFIALVQAAALAPITSIADALSVNAAKPQVAGKPFEYGWIRGSASAAFATGTLIIGHLISRHDLMPVVWMNATLLLATSAAATLVPSVSKRSTQHTAAMAGLTGGRLIGVGQLLRMPGFRILIIVSAAVYGSHAMHDAFAVIRWSDAGMDSSVISWLWAEAVAAEVIVFVLLGPAFVDQFGARGAATLAAAAGIVRWSIEGGTTSVLLLSMLQPLHGLTFALLHLACMRTMAALVPANMAATAQSFYAAASGLVTAALTLLSGVLYARYGGASFFVMAVLCLLTLPFAWFGFGDNRSR